MPDLQHRTSVWQNWQLWFTFGLDAFSHFSGNNTLILLGGNYLFPPILSPPDLGGFDLISWFPGGGACGLGLANQGIPFPWPQWLVQGWTCDLSWSKQWIPRIFFRTIEQWGPFFLVELLGWLALSLELLLTSLAKWGDERCWEDLLRLKSTSRKSEEMKRDIIPVTFWFSRSPCAWSR